MTSYIKGLYGYIRTEGGTSPAAPPPGGGSDPSEPSALSDPKPGYLKRAVTGVASGIYTVGTTTVGAGVSSVRWVAGTTYTVGAAAVGTAGSVVAGTAGTVASTAGTVVSTVGSGASNVISKVTAKKKEHSD